MRHLTATLTLIAALLLPAAAGAAAIPTPAAQDLQARADRIADQHWHAQPCGGHVTTAWAHLGTGTVTALATWTTPAPGMLPADGCTITYNLDAGWSWPKFCTITIHERGHLTGHTHVADPADVMYEGYILPAPECAPPPHSKARRPKARAARHRSRTHKATRGKHTHPHGVPFDLKR